MYHCFFLVMRRPPRSTLTDTRFPTLHSADLLARDGGYCLEIVQGLFYGQIQHFADAAAAVAYFQRFAVVALATTDIARHVHIGQEMHLDRKSTRLNSSH